MTKPTALNLHKLLKVIFFTSCFFLCHNGFAQLKKLPLTDSAVTLPAFRFKNQVTTFKQQFLSPVNTIKNQLFTEPVKGINNEITGLTSTFLKNPLVFHSAELSYQGYADSSYLSGGQQYYQANFEFSSSWSIADIPLAINTRQQSWTDYQGNSPLDFSFRFEREAYLAQLKKKLAGKIDPSAVINQLKNPFEALISTARQTLLSDIDRLNADYKGLLADEIDKVRSLQDLFTTDTKSLKNKFLSPAFVASVSKKQNLLAILQQQLNNGEKIDTAQLKSLREEVFKLKGLQELVQKIEQHKGNWEKSGLLEKIKQFNLFKQLNISKILNDPSAITKFARQKLSLNGLQRFFLKVNHLDIGQNAFSSSPLGFQHFLSKGIHTELISNSRSLLLVAGKQTDFNSVLDYPFSSPIFSNNGTVKAFGIGSGKGKRVTTDMSISSFSQSTGGLTDPFNPALLRQILVTTISNQLMVGEKGMINVELSRSATQYNQPGSNSDSSSNGKNGLSRLFSTDNFMANTAVSLKYADEFADQGISYHIQFNKTSNGYTNPGNNYLVTGNTEFGAGIRKSMFKKKLLISLRAHSRVYKYNDRADRNWVNNYLLADIKWKMKKGQYFSLRYQPVTMSRNEKDFKQVVSAVQRLAADASLYKKIGKISYRNFISLSGQWNRYVQDVNSVIRNNSVTLSSFQQLQVGNRMFYMNLNFNHADNSVPYLFLNSSLYAETGYTYQLLKNFTGSSGFVYTATTGWYKQAGIRQTLAGQLGERFNVTMYLDIKKNLQVVQPLWNEPVRADISLRYNIINMK